MGKAIAIFNQKGGVGKTTTNINLAACLARRGKKVLMVDIDPQGNTTSGIGIRKRTLKTTLYDALIDTDFDVRKAVLPTNTENLFLIPASVDLAGAEGLYPNRQYGELFKELKAKNIPFTVHAGEADGPDGVWAAIEGGARRIGHGVRATEDPALMAYLAKEKIPLELCPTSNLHTHIFSNLQEFPLRTLMENGVVVTVNSDNMTVSDTNVVREIENLTKAFSLSEKEQEQLLINAANSVF